MLAVLAVLTVLAVLAVRRRGDACCLATRRRDGGGGVGAGSRTAARLYAYYTMAMLTMLTAAILTMAHRCEAVRGCHPQVAARESPQAPAAARASPK